MRNWRRKLRSFWVKGWFGAAAGGDFDMASFFFREVVEGDGGFEHEQHIEPCWRMSCTTPAICSFSVTASLMASPSC